MASKKKKKTAHGFVSPQRVLLVRVLTLVAAALSGYLLWVSLSNGNVVGCAPGSGCDEVLSSNWAYWLGIPVSALALATYIAIFLCTRFLNPQTPPAVQKKAWILLLPAAAAIILAAAWFVLVQAAIIKSFCPFCMATHLAGLIVAGILLLSAPLKAAPQHAKQQQKQIFIPLPRTIILLLIGTIGFGVVIAGQSFLPKKQYLLEVFNGRFEIDAEQVPTLGDPKAPHRILSLFDYTCKFCRILHPSLVEIQKTFGDQLCIINVPMPLSSGCNHLVKRDHPDHVEACDYARLGLAVFRLDRERHHAFEEWIFTAGKFPSLQQARTYAQTLVGRAALATAMQDPWISQQISNNIAIYSTSTKGDMPQLIIGDHISYGTPDITDLYRVIDQQLGLKKP